MNEFNSSKQSGVIAHFISVMSRQEILKIDSKIIQNAMEMRVHADYSDFLWHIRKMRLNKAEQFLGDVESFLKEKEIV